MSGTPITFVNLIPVAAQKAHARRRCATRWLIAFSATSVFVGLPGLYIGGNTALSDSSIGTQIEMVSNQLSLNKATIPLLQLQLTQLQEKQEVLELVENRIDWGDIFGRFVSASSDLVRFSRLSATGGGVEGDEPIVIEIEGVASSQTDARAFVVSIESLELFDQVELARTARRDIGGHELIEFLIIVRVGEATPATGVNP